MRGSGGSKSGTRPSPTAASANEQTDFRRHRLLTLEIQHVVGGDPVQPRAELAVSSERVKRLENANEDFLCDIHRILAAAEHSNGDVQDPGLMPREQSLQCVAISFPGFRHQFFIRNILDGLKERIAHRGGHSDHSSDSSSRRSRA